MQGIPSDTYSSLALLSKWSAACDGTPRTSSYFLTADFNVDLILAGDPSILHDRSVRPLISKLPDYREVGTEWI